MVDEYTAGDPITGLKWTRKTTEKIAEILQQVDISVSPNRGANPHPEAVHSELFQMEFFDPYDFAQVKYEMLRAHSVDEDPVAEVCRQFGLSRESFYQIQQAFRELGFSSFLPRKRGRKGPVKLKGEVLEFALAQQKEQPNIDPGRLAALIEERYGIALHRTTVLRGLKKKLRSATEGTRTSRRRIPRERRPRAEDL